MSNKVVSGLRHDAEYHGDTILSHVFQSEHHGNIENLTTCAYLQQMVSDNLPFVVGLMQTHPTCMKHYIQSARKDDKMSTAANQPSG